MGISDYYFKGIDSYLIGYNYWDMYLTSDNEGVCLDYAKSCKDYCDYNIVNDGLALWFDVNNSGATISGTSLISLTEWSETLIKPQSGITLCDFGLTGVDNGRHDQLSGITTTITSADTKVVLYPVTGYTITNSGTTKGKYDYEWSFRTGSTTSEGCEVGKTICLNGGFYQGYFKLDFLQPSPTTEIEVDSCGNETTKLIDGDPNLYGYDLMPTNFKDGWTMETWVKWDNSYCQGLTGKTLNSDYTGNTGFFFYIGTRAENKFRNVFSGESGLYTCDGLVPLQPEVTEPIDTSGQDWFINSREGCNIQTGTTTGSTNIINKYCDELSENALGFRVTPEGKIGYRKMTVSTGCYNNKERITGTTMVEGYSDEPFVQSGNTWYHVVVTYTQNGVTSGLPSGTLRFWVNGRVVYRVENFIGLQLRALDEWSNKQLGVPFNISWGGGTQGLLESQTFGGPDPSDGGLDLETNFAGTFEGELSQLRFYEKPLNILEIRNNLYVDCNRYCVGETYGGSQIVQPDSNLCGECESGTPPNYLLHNECYIITENGDKIIL
jgi:hypothetical protein